MKLNLNKKYNLKVNINGIECEYIGINKDNVLTVYSNFESLEVYDVFTFNDELKVYINNDKKILNVIDFSVEINEYESWINNIVII
jgi:hypothetical protein